jgi:hypothetical protein
MFEEMPDLFPPPAEHFQKQLRTTLTNLQQVLDALDRLGLFQAGAHVAMAIDQLQKKQNADIQRLSGAASSEK